MTAKNLNIGDLFNTNVFKNKKILDVSKMLHTMKDAIAFTEENAGLEIDSRDRFKQRRQEEEEREIQERGRREQ